VHDGQDLIGRTGGYAVGNWTVVSCRPHSIDHAGTLRRKEVCDLV
jgi:hypothetical protein